MLRLLLPSDYISQIECIPLTTLLFVIAAPWVIKDSESPPYYYEDDTELRQE